MSSERRCRLMIKLMSMFDNPLLHFDLQPESIDSKRDDG